MQTLVQRRVKFHPVHAGSRPARLVRSPRYFVCCLRQASRSREGMLIRDLRRKKRASMLLKLYIEDDRRSADGRPPLTYVCVDPATSGRVPDMISTARCPSRMGSRSPCFASLTIVWASASAATSF